MPRRRRPARTRLNLVVYIIKMLWIPVACLGMAMIAFRMSDNANLENEAVEQAEASEFPALITPVLSARRLPETLATPGRDARLQVPLFGVMSRAPADTCLVVRDADGRDIFTHQADRPVVPASAQKILTAYAALKQISPDAEFETRVVTNATINNGVVQGDIWIVGGGDPVLSTTAYARSFVNQPQVFTSFEVLADRLVAAGVTSIEGNVHGEDNRYDETYYVATWPDRFAGVQSGPLSAVAVNDGFTDFPAEGQEHGGSGARSPTQNAEKHTAREFIALLQERGVSVGGAAADDPAAPASATLAAVKSPPMSEIVGQMLAESDNRTAEMLLKEIGLFRIGTGTTEAGIQAMQQVLVDNGLFTAEAIPVDGSGLSSDNIVTCDLLVDVLADEGPESVLADGLAVAGETGTLADRFRGSVARGKIRAKTGTLNEVTALAGFADTLKEERLTFAVVINGEGAGEMKAFEEEIGRALMSYPDGPTTEQLGPVPVS